MNKPTPHYVTLARQFNLLDYWVVDYDYVPEHIKQQIKFVFFTPDAWN